MKDYMHYSDVPDLLNSGFKYSPLSHFILWGKDTEGNEYQVVEDGEYLKFGKRRANGGVDKHRTMTRTKFEELFK
jgi:hypothetical protein